MICGNVNAKDDRIAAFGVTDVQVRIRVSLLYLRPVPQAVARRKYSLAIPPGTVADLYGNEFEGIPPDMYTFHTFEGPLKPMRWGVVSEELGYNGTSNTDGGQG